MKIVSSTQPPELTMGSYWERSKDPFHIDEIKAAIEQQGMTVANPEDLNHGKQAHGWMMIDWIENPIGFVADGSDAGNPQEFEIRKGPHGRDCAYPTTKEASRD